MKGNYNVQRVGGILPRGKQWPVYSMWYHYADDMVTQGVKEPEPEA